MDICQQCEKSGHLILKGGNPTLIILYSSITYTYFVKYKSHSYSIIWAATHICFIIVNNNAIYRLLLCTIVKFRFRFQFRFFQTNIHSIELSPWTDWTPCSKSCGTGDRTRTRNCVLKDCPICAFGRDEKNPCGAPLFERELCNQQVIFYLRFWLVRFRLDKQWWLSTYLTDKVFLVSKS